MNKNSGVYKIINCITKRIYIGSSNNLRNRKISHFSNLRNNNHKNKLLQKEFNVYGEENFKFKVIRYNKDNNNLFEMEQFWLDKYFDNQNKCYNIYPNAKGTLGIKRSYEVRKKMSEGRNKKKVKKEKSKDILYKFILSLPKGQYKKIEIIKNTGISRISKLLEYDKIQSLVNDGKIIIKHHIIEVLN